MNIEYYLSNKKLIVTNIIILAILSLFTYFAFADITSGLLPTSDGTYLQWTPKTGSTHYTMVDESSCNGTTDYNSTTTVGNRDSYSINLSSVEDGSTITSISITPCASRNNSGNGSSTMNVFYKYNGSDSADAGNYALSGTTPTQLSATNFSGLTLSKSSSSTLEVGAVYSSGTKGARLSRISVVITYTPPASQLHPSVVTDPATNVASSSATLNGTVNPNGLATTGWFRLSSTNPGACNDSFGTRVPSSGGNNLGSGISSISYSRFSGIFTGVNYYCAIANNSAGTSFGKIASFSSQ